MKTLFAPSRGRKQGAIDGLNLFFGALLGANLGTLAGLRLVDYLQLTALLAGTVMALRMISTAEKRGPMFVVLGIYAALLVALVALPGMKPKGMGVEDLHRLVATLAVWLVFVLGLELSPMADAPAPADESEAKPEPPRG
jgi:hypothetical protein